MAEQLILESLTVCTPRQACEVMEELENRILSYENDYRQESKERCLGLLQRLSDEMITPPRVNTFEDLLNIETMFQPLKQQYVACISAFVRKATDLGDY